ncbi:TetR/AcrR family transcriptional regulator [Chelatococcus asaccharovorans]|uniref:TetR family transcriptional regulator n=1 Tax=Chelatococcus asaccharovorans TaxID=28210 RepID=A0A2V3UAK2_9HYPH|nr:TetR/AcrR family transcriptional regulator [Chelatococcus asaccharovorans]PXW61554.1 TetR family transcriptional regulator [Chelatococcus asaccharovorans]
MDPLTLASKREDAAQDSSKRRDILNGARHVFRAHGFDGASMGDIAKAASVSKGTLYVYFDSKEALFRALIDVDRRDAAERLFDLDQDEPDVRGVLTRLATSFISMMIQPDHVSLLRMVIGAAEKFPALGRAFFEAGPCYGVKRLSTYLAAQRAAGRLLIEDTDLAAAQFMGLIQGSLTKGPLFGVNERPSPEDIEVTVASAVRVFFAAYGPKASWKQDP